MDFPINPLFSSALGAIPTQVDKKKYFKPVVQADPNPSPAPKPTTAPGVLKTGLGSNQKTEQANKNAGLGSPGYGYTEIGKTRIEKSDPLSSGAPAVEERKTDIPSSPEVKSMFGFDSKVGKIFAGIVILLIVSILVFGLYHLSKKSK